MCYHTLLLFYTSIYTNFYVSLTLKGFTVCHLVRNKYIEMERFNTRKIFESQVFYFSPPGEQKKGYFFVFVTLTLKCKSVLYPFFFVLKKKCDCDNLITRESGDRLKSQKMLI